MTQIPLIKGDRVDSNVDYRDALPVNMYAVPRDILGAKGYMINFYGLTSFTTGRGVDRGGVWVAASGIEGHYRVSGSKLIEVSSTGVVAELGDVGPGGQVSFAYSFNNLAVVSSGRLYYYNRTAGFRQITDPQVGSPIDIVWVDGYFFLTDGDNIYHSNIANEEAYEPLAFSNAQFIPDSSRGLSKTEDNEVIVWGEFSKENFRNVGAENFAFQRIPQKASRLGIAGTHSKAELNGDFYTLGRRENTSLSFYLVGLGRLQNIGTRETDKIVGEYADDDLSEVIVDTFIDDDQAFVVYHLPRHTLMFNVTIAQVVGPESAWSILKSDTTGDLPLRAKNYVRDPRIGKWLTGDRNDATIGELDPSINTQYGNTVEWILFTPMLKGESSSIDKIELEIIPGITDANDATVFVSLTYDARTYGKEWSKEYGMQYQYNERFIVRRFGYIRNWFGMKLRGVSKSRMSFAFLNMEAS